VTERKERGGKADPYAGLVVSKCYFLEREKGGFKRCATLLPRIEGRGREKRGGERKEKSPLSLSFVHISRLMQVKEEVEPEFGP